MQCTTERLLRLLLVAFCSSLARGATRHPVLWTPEGVERINHTITAKPGDEITFICPRGSFSTTWFMTEIDQYTNCNCESGAKCILISNCEYFNANNFSTAIQRTSENLQDTPDYQPGRTYYFTSFSWNTSTLSHLSQVQSGGECSRDILRLEIKVLQTTTGEVPGTDTPSTTPDRSIANPTDTTDSTVDVSVTNQEVKDPQGLGSVENSQGLPISLSLPLVLTVSLVTLLTHFLD
ncbi:hypothetical protein GBAR_LOCUS23642 [Geodia barretti]|uniref:Ephrin RBD domain-containing protein n=1 Tax=Geodia barretti TaxID=519541 RepID=A0AA35X8Z1_GEOBA|nr:hypothetical protein GBAR_LOCUS23642 [Geodia barretti]